MLIRIQYAVYASKEDALAAGYQDAEFGTWQPGPGRTDLVEGWIALDSEEFYEGDEYRPYALTRPGYRY